MRHWSKVMGLSILMHSVIGISSDTDIDVDAARARYEDQRIVYERAKNDYQDAVARLKPYEDALSQAKARAYEANTRVQNATNSIVSINQNIAQLNAENETLLASNVNLRRANIDYRRDESRLAAELEENRRQASNLEREIQSLEREIQNLENSGDWRCVYFDHDQEEHPGGHVGVNADRSVAELQAQKACLSFHAQCDFSSCERKTPNLDWLRTELRSKEVQRDRVNQEIANLEIRIRDIRYRISQNENQEYVNTQQIHKNQQKTSQLAYERTARQGELADAKRDLSLANSDVSHYQDHINQQKPYIDQLYTYMQSQQSELNARYSYLQTVIANYEAEKQNAGNLGLARGNTHGKTEASERGGENGSAAGLSDGGNAGRTKGEADAKDRSYARGYVVGRRDGATDPLLSERYQTGYSSGIALALKKAQAENLPVGYNNAFQKALAAAPRSNVTIDISEQIPDDAGGNGQDLSGLHKDVGSVTPPSYSYPQEPIRKIPVPLTQQPSIPAQDNRYFQDPCQGLRRSEFVVLCKQNYASSYTSSYTSSYRGAYETSYKTAFSSAAASSYDLSFAQENSAEKLRGSQIGAEHLGVLNGFSTRLPSAITEQLAEGARQLGVDLEAGHILLVRSVSLEETSGDGILQPGETMKLTIVIDNQGKMSSSLESARVKISSTINGKSLSVALRGLPALAPETRTTLVGAISAVSAGIFAGDEVGLEGAIEVRKNTGLYSVASRFRSVKATHFPIELVSVDQGAPLVVNQSSNVSFTFKNMTNTATLATKMKASTKPGYIEIDNADGIEIGALEPGASEVLSLPLKPSVWAGGTPAIFSIESLNEQGQVSVEQRLRKEIAVARSAKLTLLDANGAVSDGSPLYVNAGSTVTFKTRFDFQSTTRKGPFVLRYVNASDPGIVPWNSTTRVDIGYWTPGSSMQPTTFTFKVPASLKGKQAWVAVGLDEAGGAIHMVQVLLDVR